MTLRVEYRGYTISYNQNRDSWECYDCGIHNEPTLSKVKEKIDKMHLKLRKESALECYEIAAVHSNVVRVYEATVIDYLGPKMERVWPSREYKEVGHKVAAVADRGAGRRARRETMLGDLAPITDEVHAKIEEANRLGRIATEAKEAFVAAVRDIPRVRLEDIEGLVKASEAKFEEGGE